MRRRRLGHWTIKLQRLGGSSALLLHPHVGSRNLSDLRTLEMRPDEFFSPLCDPICCNKSLCCYCCSSGGGSRSRQWRSCFCCCDLCPLFNINVCGRDKGTFGSPGRRLLSDLGLYWSFSACLPRLLLLLFISSQSLRLLLSSLPPSLHLRPFLPCRALPSRPTPTPNTPSTPPSLSILPPYPVSSVASRLLCHGLFLT